jgi:hypothetical protein
MNPEQEKQDEIASPDPVYLDASKIVVVTREDGSILYAPLKDGVGTDRRSPCKGSSQV